MHSEQSVSVPGVVNPREDWNVVSLVQDRVSRAPDAPRVEVRDGKEWLPRSGRWLMNQVHSIARGMIAAGVEPGDVVGIMARTSIEWTLVDLATWAAGAVSVPIYETSSPEQISWMAEDADIRWVFVEHSTHHELIASSPGLLQRLQTLWQFDEGALDGLRKAGDDVDPERVEERLASVNADSLATIIYTSGTTGRPKGVELTHGGIVVHAQNSMHQVWDVCREGRRILMFLPLAHVFARVINIIALASPAVTAYTPDTKQLLPDLQSFRPTTMLVVPRVFEKIYSGAEQKAGGGIRLKIFRWSAKVAIVYDRHVLDGSVSVRNRFWHAVADILLYRKLRRFMGGSLRWVVSGGAPLGERLLHFFRGLGLEVLEGYGLTETTAPISVNPPHHARSGTVGPPIPGTDVRIGPNQEIQVRGPLLFRRYHKNPQATREAFAGEWFRTGDAGTIDGDGYISITGRIKELIVTAGGKNVAPAVLEDRLRGHPLVSQCVVVGDQRPFIAALVTLDAEVLPGWLANHGLPAMDVVTARKIPAVLSAIRRAVNRANQAVSRAESIREFVILPDDFTEANGYLTPSLKVKRHLVLRDYAETIDDLYADAAARRARKDANPEVAREAGD